ncbi:hypothetical protein PMAYCL1PPCAC_21889, partial [Pristionchus mayeri]
RGFSKAQVFSWLVLAIMLPLISFCTYPIFYPYSMAGHLITWLFILIQVAVITIRDPAPDSVRKRRKEGHKPPLKPPRKGHIIVQGFCQICDANVLGLGAKHCKRCNKCCEFFDHHCVWLNTCIGGKNYRLFLCLVISVACYLTFWIVAILAVVVCGFMQLADTVPALQTTKSDDSGWISFHSRLLPLPLVGWILVDVVCFILLAIFDALIVHLLFFHYKINRQGTTTYAFIQKQRKKTGLLFQRATTDTVTGNSAGHTTTTTTTAGIDLQPQPQQLQQ